MKLNRKLKWKLKRNLEWFFNASSASLVLHVCDLLARLVRDEVLAGKVIGGVFALPPHLKPGLHEKERMGFSEMVSRLNLATFHATLHDDRSHNLAHTFI